MKKINKTEDRKLLNVSIQISVQLRYLHQDKGLRGKELWKRHPQYSKATIYRHATKPVQVLPQAKTPQRRGRPSMFTNREKQQIIREIKTLRLTVGSFAAKRLRETQEFRPVYQMKQCDNREKNHFQRCREICCPRKKHIGKHRNIVYKQNNGIHGEQNVEDHTS